ncbi:MAG: hypothetical protein HQL94_01115 [Magnetococcales bacterium]|nr:hypothetical protein [Magnetococcales bacterium]MBF0438086.1 hypothetical protein [Magnetococcales bacterium]
MKNCWEENKCGREPGGSKEKKLGTCPVAVHALADGFLGGKNGGRACIFIVGSLASQALANTCESIANNSVRDCFKCHFFEIMKKKYKKTYNLDVYNRYIQNSMTLSLESVPSP